MRTKVEHNGKTIAFTDGRVLKLHCEENKMLSDVTITVVGEEGITPSGELPITENGPYDVTEYASVDVDVQPNLQEKTAISNGDVTPDEGYDGLSRVTINVLPVPAEVSTEADMNALLVSGAVGAVYKYTGETGTYENGGYYVLEESE